MIRKGFVEKHFQDRRNSNDRSESGSRPSNPSIDDRQTLESDGSLQHAQQGDVVEGYRKNFARTSGTEIRF